MFSIRNKFFLFSFTIIFLFALNSRLEAQTKNQPQQFKILGISVEGNSTAEPAAIILNSGLKVGSEISIPSEDTRNAMNRLWGLRIFSDIQILVERTVGDGIYLLIKVVEHPRLDKVEIEGEDEVSENDLTKKITILKGQILSPFEINKILKAFKKVYEEDGFHQVKFETEIVESADTTANGKKVLKVNITEGAESRIKSIIFYGNLKYKDGDLEASFEETHQKVWWKFWRSAKFEKKKFEDDKKKLIQFYKKNGYREIEIITDSLEYADDKSNIILKIYLNEGPQYKIRNISWEGNSVFKSETLNGQLGFKTGDLFDGEKFERNLRGNEEQSDVSSLYLDNGYLMISIDPEEIKVGEDSVDIILHVRERNQFKISQVEIRGNSKTQEKVVRRELRVVPGDYFNRSAIIRSVRQLSVLNYFNPEKIKPDTRFVDDKTVDVVFDVEEKSSDTFNASVGYSEAFGATGAIGLTFNNFDIAEPLSGGGGQILNFDWQFGDLSRYQTFSISYREPWMFNTPTSFGFSVFDTKQNFYYDLRQTGATLSLGRQFKFPDDYFRGDWSFRFQSLNVKSTNYLYDRIGKSNQFTFSQIISRNSINNPLFPSEGSSVAWSLELSGPPFLPGTAEYTKHGIEIDWYTPLANTHKLALYLGFKFNEIYRLGNQNSYVPPFEYFYMGGTGLGMVATTPLRGYPDRAVEPITINKSSIPGAVMEKIMAEIRFNVALNPIPIYVLAFAEGGNIWESSKNINLFDLRRSAGIGARLLINPIGMVGFDYGYGFDRDKLLTPVTPGWEFHFQFGRGF
ncbi:MAG: outer membrane protein assembly factor BamA [Bacteroidota bacterium]